ncbi:DUF2799 domain-containing protein [Labrenzia sp. PHM005]|uniref:DUF2799 domain-containing protein n=1 Tax=Labrenzia sp. PHM005 TaxID=2590016 RepID=UPI00113FC436|nr:DUF2799 domain-containing protein [Labrenzia sp. PHM005]QDG75097.1 DUF2799 domain-containing protein [Labrenzia sp. PHM005]
MKKCFWILGALGALLLLAGCETVSQEQCVAGDWEALGQADAANGHDLSRFEKIVKDCGRHGVTPDAALYRNGWNQGVLIYCTPQNGFSLGRQGKRLNNICPVQLAAAFESSHALGRRIWTAEDRVRDLETLLSSKERQITRLRSELDDFSCGGKSGEDLQNCRNDRNDKRQDLQNARFEEQDLKWRLRDRQREYEETLEAVNAQAAAVIPGYGG